MYCWSCGTHLDDSERVCGRCGTARVTAPGAAVPAASRPRGQPPAQLRSCPACGFRGEGIPYFRRAGNLALLTVASLFTYLVGGVVYWLIKRSDRVCPSCGLSWDRSRPLGGTGSAREDIEEHAEPARSPAAPVARASHPPPRTPAAGGLPRRGIVRRVSGVLAGLFALLIIGIGIVEGEAVPAIFGGVMGLTGAATFGWGWKSLQARREAVMRRLQREVLFLARDRRGRLTATDVAAELDLSLPAAERLLLSLDDGFRVRSDVSDEGLLYFEFTEIQLMADDVRASSRGDARGVRPGG